MTHRKQVVGWGSSTGQKEKAKGGEKGTASPRIHSRVTYKRQKDVVYS